MPNPKEGGLGIHLTPTIDGNILVGASNEYLDDKADYACEQDVLDMLLADGSRIFPHLKREYFIRNFAGIRPKLASKSEGGYCQTRRPPGGRVYRGQRAARPRSGGFCAD